MVIDASPDSRNQFKLEEDGVRLDIEKEFFSGRVMRHRLPRAAVAAPSLEASKARWDRA